MIGCDALIKSLARTVATALDAWLDQAAKALAGRHRPVPLPIPVRSRGRGR